MRNKMNSEEWLCSDRKSGNTLFWKLLSILGFLAAGVFAFISLSFKKRNDQYRDMLISMSETLPDEEEIDAENRRRWQSAHAPANRKTVEERLADQRVQES
ncbi:MAG: hypothetical protein J6A56_02835 [Clostridia bacterium]|nr:hypothetical protein [Clostridia bacterium]